MQTTHFLRTLGCISLCSLAVLGGCSDDDDDDGGTGGTGGTAGSGSGKGGSSGTGKGGSSTGGSSGTSGAAGDTSTAGAGSGGDAGGTGATAGIGGAGGEGGAAADRAAACVTYCSLYYLKECETSQANSYASQVDCESVCEGASWPLTGTGNTVECRTMHAGLADPVATPDELHCGHAAENSTGVCI